MRDNIFSISVDYYANSHVAYSRGSIICRLIFLFGNWIFCAGTT